MKEILEALYEGNLKVEPVIEKRSKRYQKACDTSYALVEELSKRLGQEEKEMLDKVIEALNSENYCYTADRFVRGYRLGALMMLEIMEDWEDFIIRREA